MLEKKEIKLGEYVEVREAYQASNQWFQAWIIWCVSGGSIDETKGGSLVWLESYSYKFTSKFILDGCTEKDKKIVTNKFGWRKVCTNGLRNYANCSMMQREWMRRDVILWNMFLEDNKMWYKETI